jgi:hypothetical protein
MIATLGLIAAAGGAAYGKFVRPWHLRWGATDDEVEMPLPGDLPAEHRTLNATHAITIDAPAEDVWPWVAQIGQNKAGCYSYGFLENAVGCKMPDVREIVPEWQKVAVGDEVWLHPKAPPLLIRELVPGEDMVLGDNWSFHVRSIDDGRRTRLIVRGQGELSPDPPNPLLAFVAYRLVFEPAHFVMERKMLLRIKELAEELATQREAAMLVGVA